MKYLLGALVAAAIVFLPSCETGPKPTPFVQKKQVFVPVVIDDAMFVCPVDPVIPTKDKLGHTPTEADLSTYILDARRVIDTCRASLGAVQAEMKRQATIIIESASVGGPTVQTTGAGSVSEANSTVTTVTVVVVDEHGTYKMAGVSSVIQ